MRSNFAMADRHGCVTEYFRPTDVTRMVMAEHDEFDRKIVSPVEFAQYRQKRTEEMWKRVMSKEKPRFVESKEFFVYGNVSAARPFKNFPGYLDLD